MRPALLALVLALPACGGGAPEGDDPAGPTGTDDPTGTTSGVTDTTEPGPTDTGPTTSEPTGTVAPADHTDCTAVYTEDEMADGTIERSEIRAYDGSGLLALVDIDLGDDGTVDEVQTFAYDADGNQIDRTRDIGSDGVVDYRVAQLWAAGLLMEQEIDRDTDADELFEELRTFAYDGAGLRTQQETDLAYDGTVDWRYTYVRDGAGELLGIDGFDLSDGDPDGVDYLWTYTRPGTVGDVRIEKDEDNDGALGRVEEWSYDADDRPTAQWADGDGDGTGNEADGVGDLWFAYTYNPDGTQDEVSGWIVDAGTGLTLDVYWSYGYDADGYHVSTDFLVDTNRNGTFEPLFDYRVVTTATWTCP